MLFTHLRAKHLCWILCKYFSSSLALLRSMPNMSLDRIEFINEFRAQSVGNILPDEEYGEAFVPEYVYDALRGQKRFDSLKVKWMCLRSEIS